MLHSSAMPQFSPAAVIDALNGLLEAELNSVFRFMDEGSPYLSRANVEVRRPLREMVETNHRHAGELSNLIEALGGYPAPRSIRSEEQYLAFLSLKFLLPKLAQEKQLTIDRYENALRALDAGRNDVSRLEDVGPLLQAHIGTHRAQLALLNKAASHAAPAK